MGKFTIVATVLLIGLLTMVSVSGQSRIVNIQTVINEFLDLDDTPSDYVGHANECVTVSGDEDALNFSSCAAGGSGDITAVLTSSDIYLLGGVTSGDANLTINETQLNQTIDNRITGGDGQKTTSDNDPYLYNDSTTIFFNETFSNGTINDLIDRDEFHYNQSSGSDPNTYNHTKTVYDNPNSTWLSTANDSYIRDTGDVATGFYNFSNTLFINDTAAAVGIGIKDPVDRDLHIKSTAPGIELDPTGEDSDVHIINTGNEIIITRESPTTKTMFEFNLSSGDFNATGELIGSNATINNILSCTEALETDANGRIICGTDATGSGGNIFDQDLNTTNNVTFESVNATREVYVNEEAVSQWLYNQSDGSFNSTYDDFAYNQSLNVPDDTILLNILNITGTDHNACTAGNFVNNVTFSNGDIITTCDAPSGSGDITAVFTESNPYLLGGAESGDINLTTNETFLNGTIDHRISIDQFNYNQSDGSFNSTYDDFAYNQSLNVPDDSILINILNITGTDHNVCGAGDFANNVTFIEGNLQIVCGTPSGSTDTQKTTSNNDQYLYNDSTTIFFNESELNTTIDHRISIDQFNYNQSDGDTTYTNGSGLSLVGTEFNHTDTSSQTDVDNSGNTFIQDIVLDTFGHITSIVSGTVSGFVQNATSGWTLNFTEIFSLDWSNVTITESQITDLTHTVDTDTNASTACSGTTTYLDGEHGCDDISGVYVDESGDTMTGNLTFNAAGQTTIYQNNTKVCLNGISCTSFIQHNGTATILT